MNCCSSPKILISVLRANRTMFSSKSSLVVFPSFAATSLACANANANFHSDIHKSLQVFILHLHNVKVSHLKSRHAYVKDSLFWKYRNVPIWNLIFDGIIVFHAIHACMIHLASQMYGSSLPSTTHAAYCKHEMLKLNCYWAITMSISQAAEMLTHV